MELTKKKLGELPILSLHEVSHNRRDLITIIFFIFEPLVQNANKPANQHSNSIPLIANKRLSLGGAEVESLGGSTVRVVPGGRGVAESAPKDSFWCSICFAEEARD